MTYFEIIVLKILRRIYTLFFNSKSFRKTNCEQSPEVTSKLIYDKLISPEPCMIARFGAFELNTVSNYVFVNLAEKRIVKYINGKSMGWWWDEQLLAKMQSNAGFYPLTLEKIEQFCVMMIEDMKEVDILGSWLSEERYFSNELTNAKKVFLLNLDPFWSKIPWTTALKGKKVLVIHPFANTIRSQYKRRNLLFENELLPEFDLKIIPAVQSIGGDNTKFEDWFVALDYMKKEIDKVDFDICLIGAGAYGFPLAAYVKRIGKKSVHLGGSLQLLFGIRGKRWDDKNYNKNYNYSALVNDFWVRPSSIETPANASNVENNCYW